MFAARIKEVRDMIRRWRIWRIRRHRARLAELYASGETDERLNVRVVKGRIAWHDSLLGVLPKATLKPASRAPAASEIKKPPPRPRIWGLGGPLGGTFEDDDIGSK